MPRFVDTNVLLYSISTDPVEANKRAIAENIFDSKDLALSAQVLGEFYVQATRPTRADRITHRQATTITASLSRYPVQALTEGIVHAALALKDHHSMSYWDAAIIEAARVAGCTTVLSEDLADGQNYDGVTIHNPFAE